MVGFVTSGLLGGVTQEGGLAKAGEEKSKNPKRKTKIIFFILFRIINSGNIVKREQLGLDKKEKVCY